MAGVPCQTRTGLCSTAEICYGTTTGCVPDPNVSVVRGVKLSVVFNVYERNFTITTVSVNGTGTTLAAVAPGANVTFAMAGSWSMNPNRTYPG